MHNWMVQPATIDIETMMMEFSISFFSSFVLGMRRTVCVSVQERLPVYNKLNVDFSFVLFSNGIYIEQRVK